MISTLVTIIVGFSATSALLSGYLLGAGPFAGRRRGSSFDPVAR